MDDYTYRESQRLASLLYYDPHNAAQEMREELAVSSPGEARDLIRATKQASGQYAPGAGELVIDVERTQDGCDSGFRNVYVATADGPDQVAELQVKSPVCQPGDPGYQGYSQGGVGIGEVDQFGNPVAPVYDPAYQGVPRYDPRYQSNPNYYGPGFDPLSAVEGLIIGGLLFHNRGQFRHRDDWREREWREREARREMYWNSQQQQGIWHQNWNNHDYRRHWREKPYSFIDRDDDHWRHHEHSHRNYRPSVSQTIPFWQQGRQIIPGQNEQPRIILPNQVMPNGRNYNGWQDRHFDHDHRHGQRFDPQNRFQVAPVDNGATLKAQQQYEAAMRAKQQQEAAMRAKQQQEAAKYAQQQRDYEANLRVQQQQQANRNALEQQEALKRAQEFKRHQPNFVPASPVTPPNSPQIRDRHGNVPNYQQWHKQ